MTTPPTAYDLFMKPLEAAGIARLRNRLLPGLQGRVLEIGAGTGVNFHRYRDGAKVVALDLDPRMLGRAKKREGAPLLACADACALPFADATFDAVVFTLVLCMPPEPGRAVREALRVLRPGGRVVTVEHVLAPGRALAGAQRAVAPLWKAATGGCHLDRDTASLLRAAGLVETHRTSRWRGILLGAEWRRA